MQCLDSYLVVSSRESPWPGRWQQPAIILADEPTGNLDSRTSQDVLGLMKTTGQRFGQTIVMITHNDEIAQMAERIIRLEDGKICGGGDRYAESEE